MKRARVLFASSLVLLGAVAIAAVRWHGGALVGTATEVSRHMQYQLTTPTGAPLASVFEGIPKLDSAAVKCLLAGTKGSPASSCGKNKKVSTLSRFLDIFSAGTVHAQGDPCYSPCVSCGNMLQSQNQPTCPGAQVCAAGGFAQEGCTGYQWYCGKNPPLCGQDLCGNNASCCP